MVGGDDDNDDNNITTGGCISFGKVTDNTH